VKGKWEVVFARREISRATWKIRVPARDSVENHPGVRDGSELSDLQSNTSTGKGEAVSRSNIFKITR